MNDDGDKRDRSGTDGNSSDRLHEFMNSAKRVAIWGAILLVVAVIAAALIPRVWAQQLGSMVNGHITTGGFIGLLFGLICTFVPLLLVALTIQRWDRMRQPLWLLVAAVVVAIPNLATLWIVFGTSNAAHAGERILDVDAPGVRGGSLVGALLAIAAFAGLEYLLFTRKRARKALDQQQAARAAD